MELQGQNSNQWDKAVCLDAMKTGSNLPCCGQMDEEDFYIQPTPFRETTSSSFYKVVCVYHV